jgi:hypothetical protein
MQLLPEHHHCPNAAAQGDNRKNITKGTTPTGFDGWVSDEKCGAKTDAECSKKCRAAGAKLVFVSTD